MRSDADAPAPAPLQGALPDGPRILGALRGGALLQGDDMEAIAAAGEPPPPPPLLPVVEVETLDWARVRAAADPSAVRARAGEILARAESFLEGTGGAPMLFDEFRSDDGDRVIHVRELERDAPLWFIGDLHGDLLGLEAALALVDDEAMDAPPRLVFLGDLFDDGGHGLEVVLRVLELASTSPATTCVVAGNHDEALSFDGERFGASVSPSDFADWLNTTDDEEARRAGALIVRLFARAPRALFLPDGLLVAHGGFPLRDLHAELEERGDWNDPRVLSDFVWTRSHPKARRKMPNRASRGSQFGHEDFAEFCALAARLGRPVTHMVRGHDHVEERWSAPPAYARNPVLTTNAMSRRLEREAFGPAVRVPTAARWQWGAMPQVHRLHVPAELVRAQFPELGDADASTEPPPAAAEPSS